MYGNDGCNKVRRPRRIRSDVYSVGSDLGERNNMDPLVQHRLTVHTRVYPGRYIAEAAIFIHCMSFGRVPAFSTTCPSVRPRRGIPKEVCGVARGVRRPQECPSDSGKIERGEVAPAITAHFLEGIYRTDVEGAKLAEEEEIVGNVGAVAFSLPQTFSVLQTVFLAMSLYPDVLKKAHAELDAVVGPSRLPDFDDERSLVYVSAIIKEAQRRIPAVPTGIPHGTTEDLELRGYLIPAGTVIMPNIWACMHDPEVFEDPETFRPERYIKDGALNPSVRDPAAFTFGFGRRICPGRYFAEAAMFINVAAALHVFDISPPLDERGNVIRIVPKMTDGIASHPEDCRCTIKPRSASAEALILAQAASDSD
ncbi:cytochrome P450, partial [Fomes fomentarius]